MSYFTNLREGLAYVKGRGFLTGAFTAGLGLTPVFWLYVLFMAIVGLVIPLYDTPAAVLLQQRVDNAFRGRVFGINTMIRSTLVPISLVLYGPLGDVVPIEWILVATGSLMVVQSLLMVSHRSFVEAGTPLPGPVPELQA